MEQLPNRENTYRISSVGFKGLLNSIDPSAIGDEYLYDMRNLMIDAGVLHTVNKALDGGITKKTPGGGKISSIQVNLKGLYWVQDHMLCGPDGALALAGDHAMRIQYFAGKVYAMKWGDSIGLYADGVGVPDAFSGVQVPGDSNKNAVAGYNGRLYAAIGSYLRFSKGGQDASLPSSWTGENQYNIIRMIDGGSIHYLFPTRSGLLIVMAGIAYMLSDPYTGSMSVYYTGNSLPTFVYKNSMPYCDGSALYYCCSDGMYILANGQTQRMSAAIWPGFNICSYYVGDYMGRLWFLVDSAISCGASGNVTYMYAYEQATGNWEKYDMGFDLTGMAPTCMSAIYASGNCETDGLDGLYIGTTNGGIYKWMYRRGAASAAPWGLTTKCYVMDESVNIRPVSVRLTYKSTAAGNRLSIKTLIDGEDCGTKVYDLEPGEYVHFAEFELPTHKPDGGILNTGNLGKSVQLVIDGTNPIEISRISLIAKARGKGEESRVAGI